MKNIAKWTVKTVSAAALTVAMLSGVAQAREPNIPFVMPPGATLGVPVGANPPPGNYLSFRSVMSNGEIVDDSGDPIGVDVDVKYLSLVYSHVARKTVLGETYRFSFIVPFVNNDQTSFGLPDETNRIGDVSVAPINLSWGVAPGIFVSAGLSINLPVGTYKPDLVSANTGTGAFALGLHSGFSYLRNGWNLSADLNYFMHAKNDDSDYRSGDEVLVNFTAMKQIGKGFSVGPVGYWRQQVTDDHNNGPLLGGTTQPDVEQAGLGIGLSKRWGGTELNVNYVKSVHARNGRDGDQLQINVNIPFGGKK